MREASTYSMPFSGLGFCAYSPTIDIPDGPQGLDYGFLPTQRLENLRKRPTLDKSSRRMRAACVAPGPDGRCRGHSFRKRLLPQPAR